MHRIIIHVYVKMNESVCIVTASNPRNSSALVYIYKHSLTSHDTSRRI